MAAEIILDFIHSSSLEGFFGIKTSITQTGFYQRIVSRLMEGFRNEQVLRDLGGELVVLAEQAHAFRRMDLLGEVSRILVGLPLPERYEAVGRYYQALCAKRFGHGDIEQAERLLERVGENASPDYRIKAVISLGANCLHRGDIRSALSLYCEASHYASMTGLFDPYATIQTQKMVAVLTSMEGNHRDALAILENLFPLAHSVRRLQPHIYYDHLNSLAVELCAMGRVEEARNASEIVLASPFAAAYPEWRDTREEIKLKERRRSRSTVAFDRRVADAGSGSDTVGAGRLMHFPSPARDSDLALDESETGEPARVLDMREWKEKMPTLSGVKSSKGHQGPAKPGQPVKLDTREMLLRIIDLLGDDRVTDDQLRRALMILEEESEPTKNKGG
jgi:tetratricopeptide (TPR) repeat protein